jgi:predicted GIY-YIG superfamily endonuclease
MNHFVYIVYSEMTDRFYIEETVDVEGRIAQHNSVFMILRFQKGHQIGDCFGHLSANPVNRQFK